MMRTLVLFAMFLALIAAEDAICVNLPVAVQTSGAWHIAKASVDLPRDVVSLKLTLAPQPTQSKMPTPDSFVSVRFEIDEKGVPVDIQVDKSSDKELEEEVIALIREWRFEAALRGGLPVTSKAYIDLSGGAAPLPQNGRPRPRHRLNQ